MNDRIHVDFMLSLLKCNTRNRLRYVGHLESMNPVEKLPLEVQKEGKIGEGLMWDGWKVLRDTWKLLKLEIGKFPNGRESWKKVVEEAKTHKRLCCLRSSLLLPLLICYVCVYNFHPANNRLSHLLTDCYSTKCICVISY